MSKSVYLSEKLGVVLLPTRGIRAGLLDLDFQRKCFSTWSVSV